MTDVQAPTCPGDLLRRAAVTVPDRTALHQDDTAVTWAGLDAAVSGAAAGFVAAGVGVGDRVVLVHPTSIRFVVDYLGALRAGAVVVPVNPAFTVTEVAHVVADSGATVVVASAPHVVAGEAALRQAAPGLTAVLGELPAATDAADPHLDRTGEDVVVLLYTSGTSGRPRGAMLSARALLANIAQVAAVQPSLVEPDDVVLLPLPLFHVFGLNGGLGVALWHATTVVLTERFDPRGTAELIARHRVTVVVGAPPLYAAWAARLSVSDVFAGVRLALSGASSLPAALVRDYASHRVPLYEGYGMTETAPVLTCNAVGHGEGRPEPKPGSIGRPLPGIDAELVDAEGEPVDDGDPGQLAVRGDNLFSGYWPDGAGGAEDGWFATGDIAVRDDDGDLWLVGRTSDMVIVNGFNVYPAEVEAVLGALDGVAEVAVVGVPDERSGEAVVAWVVPIGDTALDPDVLLAGAGRSLARYKVPSRIEIAASLPHTVTGKVQKWRLRDRAAH